MTNEDPNTLEAIVRSAAARACCTVLLPALAPQGSRRRRLWELDSHAHCPVIGVCLPISALRRLVDKALGGQAVADDYELHCGVITDCLRRSPMADLVQRELDRRYLPTLRQAATAKTTEALAAWWAEALRSQDVAGPLWATLTHARCTHELQCRVLGDVHMLQHQAGMAARVDLGRFEALVEENALLSREATAAQQRGMRQAAEHGRRCDGLQADIVHLRAQLITRDTAMAQLREDLQALEASAPGLQSRVALARVVQQQVERIQALERALLQSQQEAERRGRHVASLVATLQEREREHGAAAALAADHTAPASPTRLDDCAVLCVGGRPAAVPRYRHIVEGTGARFLHHDGGDEESSARLEATMAAADLVICQTGCISHNAYWRVKDHCKRTGKRCVFVESPSMAGIRRALVSLAPAATANPNEMWSCR